jgi:hypothetical protein
VRAIAEHRNALDRELYQYAHERFEQQVRRAGPLFQSDVDRLRARNRAIGGAARAWRSTLGALRL